MAFADVLKTFKNPTQNGGVIAKIDRYLLKLDGKLLLEMNDGRAENCFHPSELSTNNCIRSMVYKWLRVPVTNNKAVQPRVKRIFDVGHHYGYILQQYFWDMGILEGKWSCVKCNHKWWSVSPKTCPKCGQKLFIWRNLRYLEVPVHNRKYNIIGHADGIIVLDGKRVLIELKSIKNRDSRTPESAVCFEDLNAAKIEHVQQANLYIDALDTEHGGKYIDYGIIIYFGKNNQDLKEFIIHKSDMMLKPSYDKIEAVNKALEGRYLPPRIGKMKTDKHCQYCPFKDYCWDNDFSFNESDFRGKAVNA